MQLRAKSSNLNNHIGGRLGSTAASKKKNDKVKSGCDQASAETIGDQHDSSQLYR